VATFPPQKIRDDQKPLKTISDSGQQIRLKKGTYLLQYDAKDNYKDYFITINLSEKRQTVSLSPDYSDDYLNKLLRGETANLKKVILEKYPKIKQLYNIQPGRLYKKGDWYGTVLTYKGDSTGANLFKTDSLKIILEKQNGQWVVKTNPPNILLSKYDYPGIPEEILRSVNSLPISPTG
jgi:hypothetical protein